MRANGYIENEIVFVGMSDIKIGKAPGSIRTCLGSCIAVCLYSQSQRIGGMLHFMLPDSSLMEAIKTVDKKEMNKAKYADTGIGELIKTICTEYKVKNNDLVAKIFGGASVLATGEGVVGKNNEVAARRILKNEGIKIIASKTGGHKGYSIDFDLVTGKVFCQVFGEPKVEF